MGRLSLLAAHLLAGPLKSTVDLLGEIHVDDVFLAEVLCIRSTLVVLRGFGNTVRYVWL